LYCDRNGRGKNENGGIFIFCQATIADGRPARRRIGRKAAWGAQETGSRARRAVIEVRETSARDDQQGLR
jgi:hypothetical protein